MDKIRLHQADEEGKGTAWTKVQRHGVHDRFRNSKLLSTTRPTEFMGPRG